LIDIWLPDFKYGPGNCSTCLSRTPSYWDIVIENLKLLYEWRENIVIRHLILPNHIKCFSQPIIEWNSKNTPDIPVNLMDQYRPEYEADPYSPIFNKDAYDITRRPSEKELIEEYGDTLGRKVLYLRKSPSRRRILCFQNRNSFHGRNFYPREIIERLCVFPAEGLPFKKESFVLVHS
jgi:hypothetical protein